jgi:hypothetical protein
VGDPVKVEREFAHVVDNVVDVPMDCFEDFLWLLMSWPLQLSPHMATDEMKMEEVS